MKTFLVLLNQLDGSADASPRSPSATILAGTKVVASYFTLEAGGALSFWYTTVVKSGEGEHPRDVLIAMYAPSTWLQVKQIDDSEMPEVFKRPEGSIVELNPEESAL